MNKDNVKKWAEALKSGEFEQTTKQLYKDGKYCCLGVVCELAGIKRIGDVGFESFLDGEPYPESAYLPQAAIEWLGLSPIEDNPKIGPLFASAWNDIERKTFPEIAELIEKYWLTEQENVDV